MLLKRKLEAVFIFPFILLGRLIAFTKPNKKSYDIYFFFPFYHIGGAEKVHAQTAQATGNNNCIIYFTRRSHNDLFLPEFKKSGCVVKDISTYTDNKWLYFLNLIYRGIITGYINRQKIKPVVFNGQCNFAYKISPWISKEIPQIELIHSLNSFSYIRIPFLPFIHQTVMISKKRIEDHALLYEKVKIPDYYLEKIKYIPNAIPLPASITQKNNDPFIVLYVGRGGTEKRVHLIAAMAKRLHQSHPGIRFELLGDVSEILTAAEYPFIKFHGNQTNDKVIQAIYQQAAILLVTSNTEGFPMVVIEAMANGCAILSTPVGDIPRHVKQGVNGYLFSSVDNEKHVIDEGVQHILTLNNDQQLLATIAERNISYSKNNFSIAIFNKAYKDLFQSVNKTV